MTFISLCTKNVLSLNYRSPTRRVSFLVHFLSVGQLSFAICHMCACTRVEGYVVVVYQLTIVANGHVELKYKFNVCSYPTFCPLQRVISNYSAPLTSKEMFYVIKGYYLRERAAINHVNIIDFCGKKMYKYFFFWLL